MRLWSAMLAAALAAAPAAEAEVVCRPNTLGTVNCPATGVRPLPRPPYRPVQAIDRVRAKPEVGAPAPDFVPAYRTNRLGTTLLDDGAGRTVCRPDTLGNLNCR
jgi:hypothetical protein